MGWLTTAMTIRALHICASVTLVLLTANCVLGGPQSITFNKPDAPENLTITVAVSTTTVLKKFNATFTDYLNRVVSPQFDYRVTFRCEAFGEGNVLDAAEFNHMQMFFVSPVTAMCLESEFHSASLLNVRRIIHGRSPFM
eukprot:m.34973 g.34973  ORF g.34973 m.34973 type:complete len:140 (+) comp9838_c0_seq1:239-658(+)